MLVTKTLAECGLEPAEVSGVETPVFMSLIKSVAPKRYAEIGSRYGNSLIAAHKVAPEAELISIDIESMEHWRELTDKKFEPIPEHIFHKVDTRHFEVPPELVGSCDVVFVDADHRFEGVARDTTLAFRMVSACGMVIWHDGAETDAPEIDVNRYLITAFPRNAVLVHGTTLAFCRLEIAKS